MHRFRGLRLTFVLVLVALLSSCAAPAPSPSNDPPPFPEGTPRLVLFLVVDQLSQEYLVRFRPLLSGGLAYLLDNGAVFTDAHHDHANTVTGAGHATLASGCFPSSSGIISNQWYDRTTGEQMYCVQGKDYRRSPANLLVTTIGDWLKEMDPAAKVFSASGKDRSAVLMGGHGADSALWYDRGDWVTTGYYDTPEWLEEFNDRKWLDRYFATMWEPLPIADEDLEATGIVLLDEGIYQRDFPYAFGGKSLEPNNAFYSSLLSSPFSDDYLKELAVTVMQREELGLDDHPDFFGIGFHALDYVGHEFGPNSREVLDTVLRLDQTLGEFFNFVDEQVGLEHVVITLSADHGVAPIPAFRQANGEWARRTDMSDVACFQAAGRSLREKYGDYEWLRVNLYLNDEAITENNVDRAMLEHDVAELLGACESVEKVWTRSELLAIAPGPPDQEGPARSGQLFANSFHPDRSPDFEIEYTAYFLNRTSRGTTHGSPQRYDSWVPMILVAPGLSPQQLPSRVRTADMAPTLAGLMGIDTPADLDGVDRGDMLGSWR